MAEVQVSGPLVGENFTDDVWRAIHGAEPAIVGDVNGSSYSLTLSSGSDVAQLGSATQDSTSVVAGFMHRIPSGSTQSVTIPVSTNAVGRTDLIVARYDAATFTTDPGPVRLHRIAGVEGSTARPALDEAPPGVEDLPLWAVTRKNSEGLNQAGSADLRRRTGPNLDAPSDEVLPANVPLGTRAARGDAVYRRRLNSSGTPEWTPETTLDPFPNVAGQYSIVASGTVSTNAFGDAVFTLPYGGFANSLDAVFITDASTNVANGQITFRFLPQGSTKSAVAMRILSNAGAMAGMSTRVYVHAVGR